jgi:hypothetical protein
MDMVLCIMRSKFIIIWRPTPVPSSTRMESIAKESLGLDLKEGLSRKARPGPVDLKEGPAYTNSPCQKVSKLFQS